MKILQVLLSPRVGGAETLATNLEAAWAADGVDSRLVFLDQSAVSSGMVRRVRRLRAAITLHQPDVVISHSAIPNVYARIAGTFTKAINLCVLHSAGKDFDGAKLRALEAALQFRTAGVVAVSGAQAAEYRSHFPRAQLEIIPNGINGAFRPSGAHTDGLQIVGVGRVVAQKDPATWVATASRAREVLQASRWTWIGPTDVDPRFDSLVTKARAAGHVDFAGMNADVPGALRRSSLFFHTARREAHSLALLEAAASGLPIVCTREVGETLPAWVVRLEFSAGDVNDAVRALVDASARIHELTGQAATVAERVHEEFGIASVADRYLAFAAQLLGSTR